MKYQDILNTLNPKVRIESLKPLEGPKLGRLNLKTRIIVRKFINEEARLKDNPYEVKVTEGNIGLNEGIQNALDLITGLGGTAYNTGNSWLGVGTATATSTATEIGLLAATDATSSLYGDMDSTSYPGRSTQTVSWRSTFGATSANFHWQEFSLADACSNAGNNLIRKVDDQGTKVSGQSWELTLQVTLS